MLPFYLVDPSDPRYDNYHTEYRQWMNTSDNAFKCAECPARRDDSSFSELPCSQQNCWVVVTCFPEDVHF